jgi:hypothetical protein
MKKTAAKTNPLVELIERKKEALKAGEKGESFGKFHKKKGRNENNSNVGPSWGPRKGN